MSDMPCVSENFFTVAQLKYPEYYNCIKKIFSRNTLQIRSSFPKPQENPVAYYIWRNVVFNISPKPQHQSMPITSCYYLKKTDYQNYEGEYDYKKRLNFTRELDKIVNFIVNNIPKKYWHGVRRWSRAFE
ncbi:MAG: hypothetical protein QXR30_03840 [Candidatus Woesearchaeota archaeon]